MCCSPWGRKESDTTERLKDSNWCFWLSGFLAPNLRYEAKTQLREPTAVPLPAPLGPDWPAFSLPAGPQGPDRSAFSLPPGPLGPNRPAFSPPPAPLGPNRPAFSPPLRVLGLFLVQHPGVFIACLVRSGGKCVYAIFQEAETQPLVFSLQASERL